MLAQDAIMAAYRQGVREGNERGQKDIIRELKDIITDYNYSPEAYERVTDYLRAKGADL